MHDKSYFFKSCLSNSGLLIIILLYISKMFTDNQFHLSLLWVDIVGRRMKPVVGEHFADMQQCGN